MDETTAERLEAVERAITDGHSADGLPEADELESRLEAVERSLEDADERLTELEAAVQALRGFAGGIDAVDEAVERRANAAVAKVERLEEELRAIDGTAEPDRQRSPERVQPSRERPDSVDDTAAGRSPPRSSPDEGGTEGHEQPTAGDGQGFATGAERVGTGSDPDPSTVGDPDPSTEASTDTSLAAAAARTAERAERDLPSTGGPADRDDAESEASLADRLRRLL
jgi:hypothetical protein